MDMDVNDCCCPPYTIVSDDDYQKLCPWAAVTASGREWPSEMVDAVVEVMPSEEKKREQRRKKKERKTKRK